MTEAEWLACDDPTRMTDFIRRGELRGNWRDFARVFALVKGKATERKQRLYACGCCRRLLPMLTDKYSRNALAATEAVADGLLPPAERTKALRVLSCSLNRKWGSDYLDLPEAMPQVAVQMAAHRFTGISVFGTTINAAVAVAHRPICNSRPPSLRRMAIVRKAEHTAQAALVREIFGNPFRPVAFDVAWRAANVTSLAEAIYTDRAFDRLPILADALEDAGCDNRDILDHCRQPGVHVRGCWVVDLALGKE